ncbi:ABC transporter permease [Salinarimonas soli]|uniref:ABC transporter permease n=1 Tax=Salinarimonas soli TaxID=1638099 RepID=A0A5B2W1Y5_9HYPH|nr:ABC transporter permease [Salinarimonas soli]KAA2244229.1 ABC transporter permease [Salinarimonas soli]
MLLLVLRRVLATVPVMAVVALVVFLMIRLTPGDPAAVLAGDNATLDQIQRIRANLGLDEPLWHQFAAWVGQLARGDLGTSIFTQLPVTTLIGQRVEPTLMLALTTMVFSILVAVPLGVLAAWKAGTWIDRLIMVVAVVAFSFPVFVLGYLLVYQFGISLRWLPTQGYRSPFADPWGFVRHMTLPALALSSIYIALITRITRASVLEVLGEDYIRTARAKGQTEAKVLFRHALGNAAVPIVTIVGIGVALLIGGAVVTETVFNIPGLGRLVVDAILRRDYPIIQGLILVFSLVYILINLLIDIAYTALDPRIRY